MLSESQESKNSLAGSSAWGLLQAAIKVSASDGVSLDGLTGEGGEGSASSLPLRYPWTTSFVPSLAP